MKTLTIKDLPITEHLDSNAMSAVRGGTGPGYGFGYPLPSYFSYMPVYAPDYSKKVDATQVINTTLNMQSANGNNSALVWGTTTNMNPRVYASNNVYS